MGLAVCLLIFAVILFIGGMMFSQWQAEKLRQRNAGLAHDVQYWTAQSVKLTEENYSLRVQIGNLEEEKEQLRSRIALIREQCGYPPDSTDA